MNDSSTECVFDGCVKPIKHKGLGICAGHLTQHYRGRELTPLAETWSAIGPCRFDGCKGERRTLGYCGPHYRQQLNGKPLTAVTPLEERICSLAECQNPAAAGARGRPRIYCSDDCMHEAHRRMRLKEAQADPYQANDGYKLCGQCQDTKQISEYHNDKKRKDGLYPWCKDCRRVYMGAQRAKRAEMSRQEYERKRRERLKRELGEAQYRSKSRDNYLKGKYGIGINGYQALLDKQGGGCGICGLKPEESTIAGANNTRRNFAVDHDHACCAGDTSCGRCVRGILCHLCNVAIGAFQDNTDSMRAAIDYVSNARSSIDAPPLTIAA